MPKALCNSGGLLKNIIDNLDGDKGDQWAEYFRRTLRRQNPFTVPVLNLESVFSHVSHNSTNKQVLDAIETMAKVHPEARAFFGKKERCEFSAGYIKETVALVSPKQLGFTERTKLRNLYVRAEELGLEPCHGSTAVKAFLCESDKFPGGHVYCGMEPEDGVVLYIGMLKDEYFLSTGEVDMSSTYCGPNERWAFAVSK